MYVTERQMTERGKSLLMEANEYQKSTLQIFNTRSWGNTSAILCTRSLRGHNPKTMARHVESPRMWRASWKVSSGMPRESNSGHCTCFCSRAVPRSWPGLPLLHLLQHLPSGLLCCPWLPVLRRTQTGGQHLTVGPGQRLGGPYWYHPRAPRAHNICRNVALTLHKGGEFPSYFFLFIN